MTTSGRQSKKKGKKYFEKKSKTAEATETLEILAKQLQEFDSGAVTKFEQYPISTETKQGLKIAKYEEPTPIQRLAIQRALLGRDILGAAKTGSGKTIAFLIPVLERLYKLKWSHIDGLGALIVSPTRELATQIYEVLSKVGKYHKFRTALIIGGSNAKCVQNEQDLIRTSNIVICTPGRMRDHIEHAPQFNVDNLQILVLDEADRLLDSGFEEDISAIVQSLPTERQTLLFSATQTKSVRDLARLSLKSPVYVSPDEHDEKSTPDSLTESYTICALDKKLDFLWSFIRSHLHTKILVFFSTCKQVRFVYEVFCKLKPGLPLDRLHRARKQHQRIETYKKFERKQYGVLFATDLAARGLDFPTVNWVLQMDCPHDVKTYIHRAGRTARNQKAGNSLLVLLPSEEEAMVEVMEKARVKIKSVRVNPKELSTIKSRIQSLCVCNTEVKDFARMAFLSYAKFVFKMSNKQIFNITKLPLKEFAQSLGLHTTPKLRFVVRAQKQNKNNEVMDRGGDSSEDSDEETRMGRGKALLMNDEITDESDDELFTVKKLHPMIQDDEEKFILPTSKRKQKTITKVQEIKQMLKHVKPSKIVFDDSGDPIDLDAEAPIDALDHAADLKLYKERLAREQRLKKQKKKNKRRNAKQQRSIDNVSMQLKTDEGFEDHDDMSDETSKRKISKLKQQMSNKEKKRQLEIEQDFDDDDRMETSKVSREKSIEAQKRKLLVERDTDDHMEITSPKKMKSDSSTTKEDESLSWLM